jgi:hypothetical protein
MERHGLVPRPGGELALGELGHQPGEALHPLAVESREHQPSLLEMRTLVQEEDRIGAQDRLEDPRALAGMKHVGRSAEQLLDLGGVGQGDERGRADDPQGEALPVSPPALLE